MFHMCLKKEREATIMEDLRKIVSSQSCFLFLFVISTFN